MGAKEKVPEVDVGTGVCSDDDEDIGGSPGNETDGFFSFRLLSSSSSAPASPKDGLSVSIAVLVCATCAVSAGLPKLNENELDDAGAAKSEVVFSTLAVPNENEGVSFLFIFRSPPSEDLIGSCEPPTWALELDRSASFSVVGCCITLNA